jgi:uncharacterized Tic20 family protein
MNEQNLVPRNARWWAIACYLSGLLYLVIIVIIAIFSVLIPQLISSQNQHGLIALALNLIPWVFWASLLAPLLAWKLAKNIHPFANSAGKTAWNLMLNLIVLSASLFLLTLFLSSLICGVMEMKARDNIVDYIFLVAFGLIIALVLTHFLCSLVGAGRAWRGTSSTFPTLRFLKK